MLSTFIRARRPGLSLTEVLIAIFVMAIGMISLLVLFPVGMLNTRWGIEANRSANSANNANATADLPLYDGTSGKTFSLRTDPAYRFALQWAVDDANNRVFWNTVNTTVDSQGRITDPYEYTKPNQWAFDVAGPAPAIYVDSVGALQWQPLVPTPPHPITLLGYGIGYSPTGGGANNRTLSRTPVLGPLPAPFLARQSLGTPRVRSVSMLSAGAARTHCVLPDDIAFEEFGGGVRPAQPNRPAIPFVQREKRYSWAYMCRWPRQDDQSFVDMSVVIYGGRLMSTNSVAGGTNYTSPPNEVRYFGPAGTVFGLPRNRRVFMRGSNEAVIISGSPTGAPLRKGDWVLDNTLIMPTFVPNTTGPLAGTLRYYGPFADELRVVPMNANLTALGFDPNAVVFSGLSNGHFYQVASVGNVTAVGAGVYAQTVILDRPAKADGYELVHMAGVINVIEKNAGKTPVR
jgi:hypothetical protein